jgi:hypothetical protein
MRKASDYGSSTAHPPSGPPGRFSSLLPSLRSDDVGIKRLASIKLANEGQQRGLLGPPAALMSLSRSSGSARTNQGAVAKPRLRGKSPGQVGKTSFGGRT